MVDEKIGQYYPELVLNEENIQRWRGRIVTSIPECRTCKYALLCSGGCTFRAMERTGEILSSFCDQFGELLALNIPRIYDSFVREQAKTIPTASLETRTSDQVEQTIQLAVPR
jgi:uncharacterized protein